MKYAVLGVLALLLSVGATEVRAESCMPRPAAVEQLTERWGETPQLMGILDQGGSVLEFYGNEETGTWTVMITDITGISCLKAAGEGWALVREDAPVPGRDS